MTSATATARLETAARPESAATASTQSAASTQSGTRTRAAASTGSAATARAVALVADRKPAAEALGRSLAEHVDEPDAFAAHLAEGFRALADPEYLAGSQRVAPGIGRLYGVRWPLTAAVDRGFRTATRRTGSDGWLEIAARLYQEPELECRWFAFGLLDRVVLDDPERAWQLLRRGAREAADWITVDTLAHPVGRGILNEAYRWAELDGLVFSPSRWERRLVGSTVATAPFVDRRRGRATDVAMHGLALVDELIGDSEPDVQKALAWALRSLVIIDADAVLAFVERQAEVAAATDDGYRAWVLRDVLVKLPAEPAAAIRTRLDGLRRRAGAPSTSRAGATAARFQGGARLGPDAHRDRFPDPATPSPGDPSQ